MKKTAGIHHISAIVGHPQENTDFYAGVLGLRMIKKTVNFDDPGTYHLYFGNEAGEPGTIITFFPWANAYTGAVGGGQTGVTSYVIPLNTMDFWEKRLESFHIHYTKAERFGEASLRFNDPHGLKLELVERESGKVNGWSFGDIKPEYAIKGFSGATLYSVRPEKTMETLTEVMGLEKVGEEADIVRFKSFGDIGNVIDVRKFPMPRGKMGVGTVHHIAWRAENEADHLDWQKTVREAGYMATEVKDRNYFNAIYFREYGEILFEIATDPPGFTVDEAPESLGSELKLPPQYEAHRETLVQSLIPIKVPGVNDNKGHK